VTHKTTETAQCLAERSCTCGVAFRPRRPWQVHHGPTCRTRAWRERRRRTTEREATGQAERGCRL
jgi:hypothetical protein